MTRIVSILTFTILVAVAGPAMAETFDVGERGATLKLGKGWKRFESFPGMGKDQFAGPASVKIVVLESVTAFQGEASVLEVLRRVQASWASSQSIAIVTQAEPTPVVWPGVTALSGGAVFREAGLTLQIRVLVINHAHLNYLCMVQGLDGKKEIDSGFAAVRKGLRLPPADSPWSQAIVETPREIGTPWGKIVLNYSPRVWSDDEIPGSLLALEAADDLTTLSLFHYDSDDLDESVRGNIEYIAGELDGRPEPQRTRRTYAALAGQELKFVVGAAHVVYSLLLPVDDQQILEIRFECPHSPRLAGALWEDWLKRIRLEKIELDPFPTPLVREKPGPGEPPPGVAAWLSESRWLGTAPGIPPKGVVAAEEAYFAYGRGGVQRIAVDGAAPWHYRDDERTFSAGSVFSEGATLLMRFGDTLYRRDEQGDWHESPHGAYAQARLGKNLVVVRRPEQPQVRGFSALSRVGNEQLLSLGSEGQATTLHSSDSMRTTWIGSSGESDALFLAREPRRIDGSRRAQEPLLCVIRSSSGEETSAGSWTVRHVGPALGGWVITGRPRGGAMGIHWVRPGRKSELLVRDWKFVGVALTADSLVCAGPPHSPARGATGGTALYEVALDVVRQHGPSTWVFDADTVNSIGGLAMERGQRSPSAIFATQESILAFVALCRTLAGEKTLEELPRGGPELDRAFGAWIQEAHELNPAGTAVLMALVCETFFERGAEWIPGRDLEGGLPSRTRWTLSSCYIRTHSPATIVAETLFDDDGYYEPFSEIESQLEGRRLVLGLDPDALESRLATGPSEDDLRKLLDAEEPTSLLSHLREHSENVYLRYEVYDQLAARGQFAWLEKMADEFLATDEPLYLDCRGRLSARLEQSSQEDVVPLIEEIKAATRRFSGAATLYLLLGDAYRKRGAEHDDRRARQCYDEVLKRVSRGTVADDARTAIDQLSEGDEEER